MNWIRPLRNSTPYKMIAVILASGKGRRFGLPKSEARVNNELFSDLIQRTLNAAGIKDIILAKDLCTSSMLETLRLAIAGHNTPADYYLVFPVDHPFVSPASILKLCFSITPDTIIKPLFQGRTGHPIIIPASLDLKRDDHHQGLARIIKDSRLPSLCVEVNDPGILRNINRPQDLTQAQKL